MDSDLESQLRGLSGRMLQRRDHRVEPAQRAGLRTFTAPRGYNEARTSPSTPA